MPTGFTVRVGAGVGGSDRVEISWADGAITNTWPEVTVEGNDAVGGFNANTGLASTDIFFFGNIVGDTFVSTPSTVDEQRAPRERVFEQLAIAHQDESLPADDDVLGSASGESLLVEGAPEFGRTDLISLNRPML